MKTIQFGLAEKFDLGYNCKVAANEKVTVEVHNSTDPGDSQARSSALQYRIGKINGSIVNWQRAEHYAKGYLPSIAINAQNTVVEFHEAGEEYDDFLYYRIGTVEGNLIHWKDSREGSSDTKSGYAGRQPYISLNDNGTIVLVYTSANLDLHYCVGLLSIDNRAAQIDWGQTRVFSSGDTPSVSITNASDQITERDGDAPFVLVAYQKPFDLKLCYRLGRIDTGKKEITWESKYKEFKKETRDAVYPRICITDNGEAVLIYEVDPAGKINQVSGKIKRDTSNPSEPEKFGIAWGTPFWLADGSYPGVAISSNGKVALQVHSGNNDSAVLYYSNSKLINSARFIEKLLPVVTGLSLKQMVLPASHDAGMYSGGPLGIAGKTQDLNVYEQLKAGIRYFDIRVDANLYIRHNFVYGPSLTTVLDDIRSFFAKPAKKNRKAAGPKGCKELVILKFSHFSVGGHKVSYSPSTVYNGFTRESYDTMKRLITEKLGAWLFKAEHKPANRRLADIQMGEYLKNGGKILVLIDEDWALPDGNKNNGFWVYRDWDSDKPEEGDLTVFDRYSNTTDFFRMKTDQLQKLSNFDGKCKDGKTPCDLFLLSWTLTPFTGVWRYAQNADRKLGRELMSQRSANQNGQIINLLYLDYAQYARPCLVAETLLKNYKDNETK